MEDALTEIRTSVTHIVHCAWEINFNHPVQRFATTQLKGVRSIADLSLSSHRAVPPRVVFLSSTAAFANYPGPEHEIPECIYDDVTLPLDQGYAESKYLAERLLVRASQATGLPVTIVRAGQLSGSTRTGAWNTKEVIPVFFRSASLLGYIPDVLPNVRWIPTDIAARILTDIILRDNMSSQDSVVVRHIESTHVLDGHTLVRALVNTSGGGLSTTSVDSWLSKAKDAGEKVPAGRLLDVFQNWLGAGLGPSYLPLSIAHTREVSAMAGGVPITSDLICMYWKCAVESAL